MADEQERVLRAVDGDSDALAELLRDEAPALREKLTGSISPAWRSLVDVDDVMQVTFMEAFLRIDRFHYRGEGSFSAWLAHAAKNNLRDAIRGLEALKRKPENQRVVIGSMQESSVALLERLGATTTTPSRNFAMTEAHAIVQEAIDRLPDDYRSVVNLYDLQGKHVSEVAGELGRSEGAVFMLRSRALDRLRELLGVGPAASA